jgi:hypothetical protein
MTGKEWAACVLALRSSYGASFKLDDAAIDVWFNMLNDLPGDRVMASVVHMVKTQESFPSIAQIRKHAEGETADPMTLWGEIQAKAHASIWPPFYAGEYHPVEWSDPLIPKALAGIGGAQAYLECNAEAMPAMRKHFCLAYASLRESAQRGATFEALGVSPGPIIGPVKIGELSRSIGEGRR